MVALACEALEGPVDGVYSPCVMPAVVVVRLLNVGFIGRGVLLCATHATGEEQIPIDECRLV